MLKVFLYFGYFFSLLRLVYLIPKPDEQTVFLGNYERKTFENQTPNESKRNLLKIIAKIDENHDGLINHAELKKWIQYTQRRYIDEDVSKTWNLNNPENKSVLTWNEYLNRHYGIMIETEHNESDESDIINNMVTRDKRRWKIADINTDNLLTQEEFAAFLHPEMHPFMRDVILSETIEDIDTNYDGKISIDEYINDMYQKSDSEEPDWVKSERDTFVNYRDINGDLLLDREEVKAWILPEYFDAAESEAKHLIAEADSNKDGQLTNLEIIEKYDLFVGSQATNYGEALTRHDEL